MADRPLDRWLRPRYVFALLALLIGISMLISSPPEREENTWRLSTYDAGPYGAKGLYLVLARLGWRTTRADKAMREALDTTAIYLILDPEGQPIAAEVGVHKGDIVVAVNGRAIGTTRGLERACAEGARWWDVTIERGGETIRTRLSD